MLSKIVDTFFLFNVTQNNIWKMFLFFQNCEQESVLHFIESWIPGRFGKMNSLYCYLQSINELSAYLNFILVWYEIFFLLHFRMTILGREHIRVREWDSLQCQDYVIKRIHIWELFCNNNNNNNNSFLNKMLLHR